MAIDTHLLEILRTRRSVPVSALKQPGPDEETLREIIEIGLRVPDHGRLEPWRISVMRGDVRITAGKAIAALAQEKQGPLDDQSLEKELTRFSRAPIVLMVICKPVEHPRIPEWEQFLSAGNVCFNLLYAARAFGFGACWVTNWFSDDRDAMRLLGLGDDERIAGFVHIGSCENEVPERPRPDVASKVSEFRMPGDRA